MLTTEGDTPATRSASDDAVGVEAERGAVEDGAGAGSGDGEDADDVVFEGGDEDDRGAVRHLEETDRRGLTDPFGGDDDDSSGDDDDADPPACDCSVGAVGDESLLSLQALGMLALMARRRRTG